MLDPAAQPHRMCAVASLCDQFHPTVIARTGAGDGLSYHARQQLSDLDRIAHAASSGAGISGTTRRPGAASASSGAGSRRSSAVARMMAATWW
jgi:hypothetical protein